MKEHKQANFFLFFPMYVCLGIYYILKMLATPFIFIWSRGSDTIYNTVTKTNSKDLKGANMGDEVTPELENTYNAKKINISPKLLAES